MNKESLEKLLELHRMWLARDPQGVEANLSKANLFETTGVNIILFQFGKHYLQYNIAIDELRIGCQVHPLRHWLKHGEGIGLEAKYSENDVHNYTTIIKSLGKMENRWATNV